MSLEEEECGLSNKFKNIDRLVDEIHLHFLRSPVGLFSEREDRTSKIDICRSDGQQSGQNSPYVVVGRV